MLYAQGRVWPMVAALFVALAVITVLHQLLILLALQVLAVANSSCCIRGVVALRVPCMLCSVTILVSFCSRL